MKKEIKFLLATIMMLVGMTAQAATITVTWNNDDITGSGNSFTKDGVTITAGMIDFNDKNFAGGGTFTTTLGNFTKIEVTTGGCNASGEGWSGSTWTGNASSVSFSGSIYGLGLGNTKFVFTIEPAPSGPTVVASGNCGTSGHESDVTWSLTDDGTLTISGTGAMANYSAAKNQPWYSYVSSITSVVVGEGVTRIGNNSFRDFTNMTSVTLPEGLESIGAHAFNGCTNASFTSITIPASVTSTGAYIFSGCTYLATVEFSAGSNLMGIGDYAFRNCNALGSITIPAGVTSIGTSAFHSCTSLGSITIPAGVTSIGTSAFRSCTSLGSIEIPAGVTSIGDYAFDGCTSLATITLNSNPYLNGSTVFPSTATVTMNLTANGPVDEKYWMTFFNNRYNFVADENTQVFKAELSGTSIILHEVTDRIVTKAEAVILKSTGNPVMTKTADTSSNEDANSLRGVLSTDGMTALDPSTIYVLNNGSQGVGFYKLASGKTLETYKAYLRYDGGDAGARAFIGFDEATGIEGVSVNENFENGEVYDLQGRRVVNPTKGLYIVNGKKVFINK